jgi:hypothetical protein
MRSDAPIRLLKRCLTAVAVSVLFIFGGSAWAQFGAAAGIAEAMHPTYMKRDLVLLDQGLNLDPSQRLIIDALFSDYESSFEDGKASIKTRIEERRDQMQSKDIEPARLMTLVLQPFREWADEKAKLEEQFLENVKVVLTQEQLEQWPSVERRLYREKNLNKGELVGEKVDLVMVIRDMHLDEATMFQIQQVVEAYEIALDQALRKRDDVKSGGKYDMIDALSEQNAQRQLDVYRKRIALQIAVRNVNDEYIERIAQMMPGDLGSQFRQSALERAYPQVYREHQVQRLFKKAKEIEGLSSSSLEAINQLEATFLTEFNAANSHYLSVLRQHDPEQVTQRASDFANRMSGDAPQDAKIDPTRQLSLNRDELCRTYARQLNGILTPEQFAQLPNGNRWIEKPPEETVTSNPIEKPGSRKRGEEKQKQTKGAGMADE